MYYLFYEECIRQQRLRVCFCLNKTLVVNEFKSWWIARCKLHQNQLGSCLYVTDYNNRVLSCGCAKCNICVTRCYIFYACIQIWFIIRIDLYVCGGEMWLLQSEKLEPFQREQYHPNTKKGSLMELWSLQFSIAASGKSKILFQNSAVTHQGSDVLRTNCVCLSSICRLPGLSSTSTTAASDSNTANYLYTLWEYIHHYSITGIHTDGK